MYRLNYRASSNLMQWTYTSLCSFTPYCPRFPTPSHRLLSIDNTCTTLAGGGSRRISQSKTSKKKKAYLQVDLFLFVNQRLPILPGRLQPSTFGVYELNYCVRDGNRWILIAIATESVRVCTLKTTQKLYIFVAHVCLMFLVK